MYSISRTNINSFTIPVLFLVFMKRGDEVVSDVYTFYIFWANRYTKQSAKR